MNTTAKPRAANVGQQFRDMAETGAERSRDVFETVGGATTDMAEVMRNCCSRALKGMQDYNNKLMEFTHANAQSHVEFVQKLAGVRSPSEFFQVSTEHGRNQLGTIVEQTKQLAELAQTVTLATTAPLKSGLAKSYDRAA